MRLGARPPRPRYHAWTGPALADLDDDGFPEVIAQGTVLDATGAVIDASHAGASAFSVVADVDGDGRAEAIFADEIFVRVYSDVLDRWASSRTIWNQPAYAVTAISERAVGERECHETNNYATIPDVNCGAPI